MKLLRVILYPLSLLYGLVVFLRNKYYDWGWFKSTSFSTPTICVGNLSLGGTGKTPMIALLIEQLSKEYSIAVLTRGYGRLTKGLVYATDISTADEIGDEPKQLKYSYPAIELVCSESRVTGMEYIESKLDVDIVLLDDAFQHRKITPMVNILLTTYQKIYSKDYYLPSGSLRDSKSSSSRADIVIVTKSPENLNKEQRATIENSLKLKENQQLFFSSLSYDEQLVGVRDNIQLGDLAKTPFSLVTGIANAKPLTAYLKSKGLHFEHLEFKDHQNYHQSIIDELQKKSLIVTTEKDFVKLNSALDQLYCIRVKHQIEDESQLLNKLHQLIKD